MFSLKWEKSIRKFYKENGSKPKIDFKYLQKHNFCIEKIEFNEIYTKISLSAFLELLWETFKKLGMAKNFLHGLWKKPEVFDFYKSFI